MSTWQIISVVLGILLLIFLLRKEFLREDKRRLPWRIIASAIAVACLVAMGLGLTINTSKPGRTAIILTDGTPDSIRKNYSDAGTKYKIVTADEVLPGAYDTLRVFGHGLSESELQTIAPATIQFYPSGKYPGITSIDWDRKLEKGKTLFIQGYCNNGTRLPVSILLRGFGAILDSGVIPAAMNGPFKLSTVPKQEGKAVYEIICIRGKDTLSIDPLPVQVVTAKPVKVLMLASSPDFENRFLKDWLAQQGYAVAIKTNISKDKFDRTAVNTDNTIPANINSALLDQFDILISDETALSALGNTEQNELFRQVNSKGMGLVLRVDTISSPSAWYAKELQVYRDPSVKNLALSTFGSKENNMQLPAEQPVFIRPTAYIQPLVTDSAERIVTARALAGKGKIVFTTLQNSYRWVLSGNNNYYHTIWSQLLQDASRREVINNRVNIFPQIPIVQEPVRIEVSSADMQPQMYNGKARIAVIGNERINNQWSGTWWPSKAGWQIPFGTGNTIEDWYVYQPHDWKLVRGLQKIASTKAYIEKQRVVTQEKSIAGKSTSMPVPLWCFFLPFIICCGFLWAERKLI